MAKQPQSWGHRQLSPQPWRRLSSSPTGHYTRSSRRSLCGTHTPTIWRGSCWPNAGGLFGNELWNDHRQQSFVWAFDAVHYPLLKIGWGVAFPSFLCFVGVLVVVFLISRESRRPLRYVRASSSNELTRPKCSKGTSHRLIEAAERFGLSATGWWHCLSLLALPTLVFQATSTKNDVAILFGTLCWYYALLLWRREKRARYLVLMATNVPLIRGRG